MRNDGSIELEIIDQARKRPLNTSQIIRIYNKYKINPNRLIDQFMNSVIHEDVDEVNDINIIVHKIRHVSDMIICNLMLNTILKNNRNLRYTYSMVHEEDGRVITVITSDPDEYEDNLYMQNINTIFSSTDIHNPLATICSTSVEYSAFKKSSARFSTTLWLGNELMLAHNRITGEIEYMEIGNLSEDSDSFESYLEDLDEYYSL